MKKWFCLLLVTPALFAEEPIPEQTFGTPAPLVGIYCGCSILHLGKDAVVTAALAPPIMLTHIVDMPEDE